MIHKAKSLSAVSLMLLLLAACGSSDLGGILGGGGNDDNNRISEIRGTVDSVDLNSRSVYLTNVSGYSSMLSNSGGNSVRVYFEDNTPVEYQGQMYRVSDLERGDQVAVRVDESGNRLIAERMTVTYNAGGTGSNTGGMYGSTVRGTVRYVDTSRRTIEVDSGSGATRIVSFGSNTPVYHGGQTYRVSDLERGDEVDIRTSGSGNNLVADQITVVRSVSGNNNGGSMHGDTRMSTVRGTVRYVDTSRRTIELESTNWISGFNPGAGSGMNTMIVQYDANTSVDVNGRLNPVTGLERGDVIDVQVRSLGGSSYAADRIVLVRDVRR